MVFFLVGIEFGVIEFTTHYVSTTSPR